MKKIRRKLNRIGALALAVVLMGTSIDFPVIAAGNCEHHTEHTEECGYKAAVEGSECTHEHGDECYSEVEKCVHSHDGECGYVEAVEGADCNHSHDENCGENGEECTHTEHTSDCGYKEPQEGSECNHECSEESGCIKTKENCNHTHDEDCGYKAAVEGTPCTFACDDCASEESGQEDEEENDTCICEDKCTADAVNEECPVCSLEEADLTLCVGEETIICTCETDDPAFHATNCPAYIAPENPQCFCAKKCTDDTLNVWCDVCGVQGVSACQGEDTAVAYAATAHDISTGSLEISSNGDYTITGSTTSNTVTVKSGVTANVTLNGVKIDCSNTGITPIMVESGATLNLTLTGDNVLTACTLNNGTDAQKTAALGVPVGAELVITENSTGTLTANGAKGGGAGIGGGYNSGAGTITINGGTVNATSDNGAGIGGGYNKSNDQVTRNGGTVTINGGTVDATSTLGAGIGGGYYGFGGTVIIKGGTVNATSTLGAGIGGGRYSQNKNNYITVTIEGGTVNATSDNGAGIGGSDQWFSVTVTINGGTINATSTYGAGIGNGSNSAGYGNLTVTITGGNINSSAVSAPTNGTSTVVCYTFKFLSDSVDMAGKTVSAITLDGNSYEYNFNDVVTLDGGSTNEGYLKLYLPEGSNVTSITVDNTTYLCCTEDGTFYTDHDWEAATCGMPKTCKACGKTEGEPTGNHSWVDATCMKAKYCSVCGESEGERANHTYENDVCTRCGIDKQGTFHIKTSAQLEAFAQYVSEGNKNTNAVLEANIDMSDVKDWTPIGQTISFNLSGAEVTDTGYTGTFDGNGHVITGLTVSGISGDTYSYGLFGTVSGTVKHLGMDGFEFAMGSASDARAGAVAGQVLTGGTIENCYSIGHSVRTNNNIAGGIAGCNYGGTIRNCYAYNGEVVGFGTRCGGVVGDCQDDGNADAGTVTNCYTDAERVVSEQNNSTKITYCEKKDASAFASGEVTYKLNGSTSDGDLIWYQTLGTHNTPNFTGDIVMYSEGTYTNHTHEWIYSLGKADESSDIYDKIVAECTIDGCKTEQREIVFKHVEEEVYLTSEEIYGSYELEIISNTIGIEPTITYEALEGELTDGKPLKTGKYKVIASLTDSQDKTVSVEFTFEITESLNAGKSGTIFWGLSEDGTLYVNGEGRIPEYLVQDYYDNVQKIVIKDGITSFEEYAFKYSKNDTIYPLPNLKYIEIPGSVEVITYRSFAKCDTLETIVIHEGVKTIGADAFRSCNNIQSVNIPDSVVELTNGTSFRYADIKDIETSCRWKDTIVSNGTIGGSNSISGTVTYTHPMEYSCSGDKIIYGCPCGETKYEAALRLSLDEPIYYTGEEIKPAVTITYPEGWGDIKTQPTAENCVYTNNTNAGTATCTFQFAEGIEAKLNFTINKATPIVETPEVKNEISYGESLSNVGLTEGWSWQDGEQIPDVNNNGCVAVKSLTDDNNYDYSNLDGYSYDATNHTLSYNLAVTVNKVQPTIEMFTFEKPTDLTYTADKKSAVVTSDRDGMGWITIKYYKDGEEVEPIAVGTYKVKIEVAQGENFLAAEELTSNDWEFTINKATPTAEMFTYTAPTKLDYDGQVKEATVTSDKDGMGDITVEYSAHPVDAGTYTVFIDVAESDNYNAVSDLEVGEFTINKVATVITAAPTPIADLVYNGTGRNLINEGTAAGGDMQYSLDGTNYSSEIPTGTDAKTYTVWYKVDGDKNHNDTEPKKVEVTIAPKTVEIISVTASDREFDGTNTVEISEVIIEGILVEDEDKVSVSATATIGSINAGVYSKVDLSNIVLTGSGSVASNYSIAASAEDVSLTPSVTISKADAPTLPSGSKAYVYSIGYEGESVSITGLPTDCGEVTYSLQSMSSDMLENVSVDANGKITYDVKELDSYTEDLQGTISVNVEMKNYETAIYTLTITRTEKIPQNISAEDITLTYGDADATISVTGAKTELSYEVVEDSNDNGYVVTVDANGKVSIENAGTAIIKITAVASDTYAESECEISVTVNKRPVNVPAKDSTVYTYTGKEQTYSIASSPYYTIGNATHTDAGKYIVSVTLNDNYEWNDNLPVYEFEIKPAAVTITANSYSVKEGDELPDFGYTVNGLVNGETLPITVSVTCEASDTSVAGTYDITVTGTTSEGNYTYTYKTGVLAITHDIELRNVKEATCTAGGYSGDKYCTVCGETIESGTATEPLGHNYVSKVTKQPTTTEEGVMTYTCSRCGDSYTKPISKLPSSGGGSDDDSGDDETGGSSGGGSTNDTPATETPTPQAPTGGTIAPTTPQPGGKTPVAEPDEETDNPEPFIKGEDGKEGWDVIRDEVEVAEEGDTVTVDMNGTTVVPGDVFDDIKGKDVTVVFDLGNGVAWSVNGKDITSDNVGDIDFEVKVGADANDSIPLEVRNAVTGESDFVSISLAYDGEFGFEAVLSVNLEKENAGLYANLFYYNPQTNEMEFICSDVIAEDGTAELIFTHASEYTIVIDKVAMDAPASSEEGVLPEIGLEAEEDNSSDATNVSDPLEFGSDDNNSAWWIILLVALLAVAGVAGFVVYSKKKKSE